MLELDFELPHAITARRGTVTVFAPPHRAWRGRACWTALGSEPPWGRCQCGTSQSNKNYDFPNCSRIWKWSIWHSRYSGCGALWWVFLPLEKTNCCVWTFGTRGLRGQTFFRPHHLPPDELHSNTFGNQHHVLLNLAKVHVRRITLNVEIRS